MREVTDSGRRPWAAALLSLLCTGLGHVYAGRITRGLTLFFLSLLLLPGMGLLALPEPSKGVLHLILALGIAMPALYLFAVFDAWRVARSHRFAYRLRETNRVTLYVLLAAVGIVYPAVTAFVVRTTFLRAHVIPTQSMVPTLNPGDRLLARLWSGGDAVEVGRVITFRYPEDRRMTYVKRVVAVAGDRVEVRDGRPTVNGETAAREAAGAFVRERLGGRSWRIDLRQGGGIDFAEAEVPTGHVFVLGDNRGGARDGRHFGFVPVGDVLGTADYLFWPAQAESRFGVIE